MNTTSQLITNAIFNLATYPEYVPILKEEIGSVLKESGGEWSLESMGKLKKLDSFMKETLRYNGHLTGCVDSRSTLAISANILELISQQRPSNEKHSDRSLFLTGLTYLPAPLHFRPQTQSVSTRTSTQTQTHLTACASTTFARPRGKMRKSIN